MHLTMKPTDRIKVKVKSPDGESVTLHLHYDVLAAAFTVVVQDPKAHAPLIPNVIYERTFEQTNDLLLDPHAYAASQENS
jgi:hypothetical protein